MTQFKPKMMNPGCIHAKTIKIYSPTPKNISFFNNLITLYSKSNYQSYALKLFNSITCPNTVTWTSIISTFSNSSFAITLFLSMLRHPIKTLPNANTFSTLLKTCASLKGNCLGQQLHALSVKLSLTGNEFVGSAFVSLYCKTGDLGYAEKVFDEMSERDEVCFAALINGFARNGKPICALRRFLEMRRENVFSTCYSVSGALRAASELAMLEQCKILHCHSLVTGLSWDVYVVTGLIDGYGKCGFPDEARRVFDELETVRELPVWNAIMAAYAQQGSEEHVVGLFRLMDCQGIKPDEYSLLAVMTAYCNAGMPLETQMWLNKMKLHYGLEPRIEHYTCLVGAMGKAGMLDEAERLALTMPYSPDSAVWRVLLSSSANHGDVDLCWRMSEKLLQIDPKDDSALVILANAFERVGKLDEVKKVRKMMRDMGVRKEVGSSWIEVHGDVHEFFAGDRRHARKDEIYARLADMKLEIEKLGYVAVVDEMEKEKSELLWQHSEKMALAFGLLSGVTPIGKPLRIVKNLRICKDCHEAFKFISVVAKKEIVVRDAHRYHRFLNGSCSCSDSW